MQLLDTLIEYDEEFLTDLEDQRVSKNTVKSYRTSLKQFINFLKEYSGEESSVGKQYVNSLLDKRLAAATIHSRVAAVQSFFSFLKEEKDMAIKNVFKRVRMPKEVKEERYIPTANDVYAIRNALQNMGSTSARYMEVFLALQWNLGLRFEECLLLQKRDINFADDKITIWGKGTKSRTLKMRPVRKVLQKHIKNYPDTEWVFPSSTNSGQHMKENALRSCFNKAKFRAKVNRQTEPHGFRRAFADKLYRQSDFNIILVSKALGHSSIAVTQRYLSSFEDSLDELLAKKDLVY